MFDARTHSDQAIINAQFLSDVCGHTGVRHDRRVLDQALNASETLGQSKHFTALKQPTGGGQTTFDDEADHATKSAHLPRGELVLWVALQTRIDYSTNARMGLKPFRQGLRIGRVLSHTNSERLRASEDKKTIHGPGGGPDRLLNES